MKPTLVLLVAVMALATPVRSQEEENAPSGGSTTPPAIPTATARTLIPHALEVPVFTPPAPPVVKQVPSMRVDAAVTIPTRNGRTLTLLRGEASTLPDLPLPPPPPPWVEPTEPTAEQIAKRIWHLRHNCNLGATIYDHKVSVVHWTDPESMVRYEAVCGFDIGLLAGVGQFIHNGETYSLMLMHSNHDTATLRRLVRNYVPAIPEVLPDSITILKGNVQDAVGTAPVTVLRELIASEKSRLIPYQAARLRYQEASAAWHAAHPPIPRNETFWFKPHRGSRYLKPATEGGDR